LLVEGAAGARGDRGLEDRVHLVRPVQAGGVLGGTESGPCVAERLILIWCRPRIDLPEG
jgi:hypothetical protein